MRCRGVFLLPALVLSQLLVAGCGGPQTGVAPAEVTRGSAASSSSASASVSVSASAPAASGSDVPAPLLPLADACPLVQDALDEAFADGPTAASMRVFAASVRGLVPVTDPKGRNLLESLVEASEVSADLFDDEDPYAISPWLDEMERVTDVCEQQGAPLR